MEMPFSQIPTGSQIAHYFVSECSTSNQGSEGFDLYRDGSDYCYIWETARLDLDYDGVCLLEVRTGHGEEETRDFLLVMMVDGKIECEWRNKPVKVFCPSEAMKSHLRDGLAWFCMRSDRLFD